MAKASEAAEAAFWFWTWFYFISDTAALPWRWQNLHARDLNPPASKSGEALVEIGRTYNVSHMTISRLKAQHEIEMV